MDPQAEEFDLVDAEGRPVGRASRAECHGNPDLLHPVVHVMVRSRDGRILLQKRSPDKDIQPDRWDTAVGGHLHAGEAVGAALVRETGEELGLQLPPAAFTPCYTYVMRNEIESELVHTWTLIHDGPFAPDPAEVSAVRFWTVAELTAALGTGELTPNFEDEWARFNTWRQEAGV
jgi:isopentenyldiphosphate isomerase